MKQTTATTLASWLILLAATLLYVVVSFWVFAIALFIAGLSIGCLMGLLHGFETARNFGVKIAFLPVVFVFLARLLTRDVGDEIAWGLVFAPAVISYSGIAVGMLVVTIITESIRRSKSSGS